MAERLLWCGMCRNSGLVCKCGVEGNPHPWNTEECDGDDYTVPCPNCARVEMEMIWDEAFG